MAVAGAGRSPRGSCPPGGERTLWAGQPSGRSWTMRARAMAALPAQQRARSPIPAAAARAAPGKAIPPRECPSLTRRGGELGPPAQRVWARHPPQASRATRTARARAAATSFRRSPAAGASWCALATSRRRSLTTPSLAGLTPTSRSRGGDATSLASSAARQTFQPAMGGRPPPLRGLRFRRVRARGGCASGLTERWESGWPSRRREPRRPRRQRGGGNFWADSRKRSRPAATQCGPGRRGTRRQARALQRRPGSSR
mmetsp:Transcript_2226/g.8572  ORF Transcript_2226/g.8572 Transcript_2226/m.8572 type:complete len:257 (+) Transcript_2226:2883-3653(+)